MNKMDYGRSVVVIRVLEKKLLTKNKFERMIDSDTPEEVLKLLGETEYSQSMTEIQSSQDYEKILKRETERVFSLVREMVQNKKIIDIMSLKYDYHNLKVLLKEKIMNKDFSSLFMDAGVISSTKLKVKVETNNYDGLPIEMKYAVDEIKKDFEEKKDAQKIDIIADKYYFSSLLRIAKELNVKLIVDYVEAMIDFQNIITLLRVKRQNKDLKFLEEVIISGGNIAKNKLVLAINDTLENIKDKFKREKIGNYIAQGIENYIETDRISEIEKIRDNYLLDLTKDSKYTLFGPEPLFTYLLAKEREINAIRMIMVGKINNISSTKVRERLSDTYV